MLEQLIRHRYQTFCVDRVATYIAQFVSANHITLLAGVIGCLILPALLIHQTFMALMCLLFSGYLDTLDGTMARAHNQSSAFGTLLDILIDRAVEFVCVVGLWAYEPTTRTIVCFSMLGSMLLCVTSFLVVGIFTANESSKSFHYSPGIMERPEAFIFFGLMMVFPNYFHFLAYLFTILVMTTMFLRVIEFKSNTANDVATHSLVQ